MDLDGILVVTLEHAVAAPYASGRLAMAGARVIKVERLEGDFARGYDDYVNGESAYFVWLNRGKESVRLDLKDEADRAVFEAMLARADVFIQNLSPGAVARLGYGVDALREKHPRLITCSISGYGEEGPYRDQKAYDLLVQAESGLASINGSPQEPGRVGVSVCDIATGMNVYQAILEALIGRERTGEGRAISVSLFHAMGDWMNVPYLQYAYGGHEPRRMGLRHPTIAPYGVFETEDGAILLSIQNEREWARLCQIALELPGLAEEGRFSSNTRRVENRAELDGIISDVFATMRREAVIERLERAGVAYGRLTTVDELTRHPQNRYARAETEAGEVRLLAPAARVAGREEPTLRVPALGEGDERLRAEFAPVRA